MGRQRIGGQREQACRDATGGRHSRGRAALAVREKEQSSERLVRVWYACAAVWEVVVASMIGGMSVIFNF